MVCVFWILLRVSENPNTTRNLTWAIYVSLFLALARLLTCVNLFLARNPSLAIIFLISWLIWLADFHVHACIPPGPSQLSPPTHCCTRWPDRTSPLHAFSVGHAHAEAAESCATPCTAPALFLALVCCSDALTDA